ncbi:MAG: tRNA pseudouridine(13) synthase TruD [Planctomycetes bacterium]|nr:tRNA pseudouridine(13) synthase TruD [Planctomycetota bacterium]
MTGTMQIADPLPQRYLTPDDGVGGRIKERPEDFVVEEIPLYEPSGSGEHLYLRVRKRGVAHAELMGCLRRTFGVGERAIGYAGMKDKQAVTNQTVSIHLLEDPPDVDLGHDRIDVLWAERHRNRIKRGHLRGNRFSIRIRDVDPVRTVAANRTLTRLAEIGAPAYFGSQRFGYRRNNHRIGRLLLMDDWSGALDELLGTGGSPFPDYQRERRELYDAGCFTEAAEAWTTADRSELIACRTLARGDAPSQAIRTIGRTMLVFWTSSLASAVFNRLLDQRIEDGTVDHLEPGDLAFKHDSRAAFAVTPEELTGDDLSRRLAAMEISPSGPLWGDKILRAAGAVGEREEVGLAAAGLTDDLFASARYRPDGARRPFRTPVTNPEIEGGFDEHGPYIRVAFDLPRGMYATVALREIMKADEDA